MARHWTFGQKIGAGFTIAVLLALVIVVVAVYTLDNVVEAKDAVILVNTQLLVDAERLRAERENKGSEVRGFLFTREERFLDGVRSSRANFTAVLECPFGKRA